MKTKRLLASVLLIAMIFNTSIAFAQDSTTDTYEEGKKWGYYDGYDFVKKAFAEEAEIPVDPIIPSPRIIYYDYSSYLLRYSEKEKDNFYNGYDEGYREGYAENRAILLGLEGQTAVDIQINYSKSLGRSLGEIYGYEDYYNNSKSSWTKAIPSNSHIISLFDLNRETAQYRSRFLSEFKDAFKLSYEEAFEFALLDNKDKIIGSAVADGKDIGIIIGNINGDRDYFNGRSNNYKRDLPSNASITNEYLLNRRLDDYKAGFINGFKLGYEEGYNEAYYNSFKEAVESGSHAGEVKGELMATKDYIENITMDWSRHKSLSSSIIEEYRLIYLSNVYRGSFINSFWVGFAQKYEDTYKGLINGQVNEKIAYGIIPIAGGTLSSPDNSISVDIKKGTFYNGVALSIEKVFNDRYRVDESRYISASDIYNIELSNPSKNLNNSNVISISMEYYGKYDGGIYKWIDNRWNYVSSIIEGEKIIININPNTLRQDDNLYRILIDKNYNVLTDIRSHWAKDEINTLIRRNIINGYTDHTFKPDRNISRAEFLALLSRVYNWNLPRNTENIKTFMDYESFGAMGQLISYGIDAGYILGYEDNTFRQNQAISYKEIEIIMGRVLNDSSFKWYNTSARILYEKQIKSNSYNNMSNKITRAEVAYMLYILNEWRY